MTTTKRAGAEADELREPVVVATGGRDK